MSPAWLQYLRLTLARLLGTRANPAESTLFDLGDLRRYPRSANQAAIRARCCSTYLGDGTALVRVLGRFKMFVDTRDIGLSSHLLTDGYWELWLTETMARLIRPGTTVADVGANLGYFTLLMRDLVGSAGTVHAFEPNNDMARRLRDSLTLNSAGVRTIVHELALGDHDGEVGLRIPEREPKNATLVHNDPTADCAMVRLCRLDAFAELADVDVIKIDVEGHEEAVWRGLDGILDRNRPLIVFIEVGPVRCADYPGLLHDFRARGFSVALLGIDGKMPKVSDEFLHTLPPHEDQMLVLQR